MKSPDAFRTISEVADTLEVPQHVLRFWESKFSQLRPMKRGGGRRYYRPEDVDLLQGIRYLLYDQGYTIRGVQKILKEQGAKSVATMLIDEHDDDQQPISVPDPDITTSMKTSLTPADEKINPAPAEAVHNSEKTSDNIIPADHIGDDDVKKLQATLYELSEIRRILKDTKEDG